MEFSNIQVKNEYEYWFRQLDIVDSQLNSDYIFLSSRDILEAHFALIDYFESTGIALGGVGPRNINLLESTISRQYTGFGENLKWQNRYEIIATLFFGLIRNHPFHDANKRTALITCIIHLERCNKCLIVEDEEIEEFTVSIADRKLHQHRKGKNKNVLLQSDDDEIRFIARWIRRNIRNIDKEYREINYEKLKTILNNHGFDIIDPRHNHINLVRLPTKSRSIFSRIFESLGSNEQRIRRIGFNSWKTNVPRSVIKEVREATGLNWNNGIDSAAFYQIESPIKYLIGKYETPLRNLADR